MRLRNALVCLPLLGCQYPSPNVGRPAPPGQFILGTSQTLNRDAVQALSASKERYPEQLGPSATRAMMLLPTRFLPRLGIVRNVDVGLGLDIGATHAWLVSSRLAALNQPGGRALVFSLDHSVLFGDWSSDVENTHVRAVWFEPLGAAVAWTVGLGTSYGTYPLRREQLVYDELRDEWRVDAVLGLEYRWRRVRALGFVDPHLVVDANTPRMSNDFTDVPDDPTHDWDLTLVASLELVLGALPTDGK